MENTTATYVNPFGGPPRPPPPPPITVIHRSKADHLGHHAQPGAKPWNRGRTSPTELISPAEIAKLINQCGRASGMGLRNRAIIVTLWRAGLRVAELTALELKDIGTNSIHVRHGKGNKRRYVAVDPSTIQVIQKYITTRNQIARYLPNLRASPYVFCTRQGRKLSTGYIRNMLKLLATKAGIERRIHPHALRHAFAVELLYESVPLNMIQAQLGHSNLAVTSNYLAHVSPKDLNAAMQRRVLPGAVGAVLT